MAQIGPVGEESINAYTKGGDYRSKGVSAALGILLIRLIYAGKLNMVEKAVNEGEIIIDPN